MLIFSINSVAKDDGDREHVSACWNEPGSVLGFYKHDVTLSHKLCGHRAHTPADKIGEGSGHRGDGEEQTKPPSPHAPRTAPQHHGVWSNEDEDAVSMHCSLKKAKPQTSVLIFLTLPEFICKLCFSETNSQPQVPGHPNSRAALPKSSLAAPLSATSQPPRPSMWPQEPTFSTRPEASTLLGYGALPAPDTSSPLACRRSHTGGWEVLKTLGKQLSRN